MSQNDLMIQFLQSWSSDDPLLKAYLLAAANAAQAATASAQVQELSQQLLIAKGDNVESLDESRPRPDDSGDAEEKGDQ